MQNQTTKKETTKGSFIPLSSIPQLIKDLHRVGSTQGIIGILLDQEEGIGMRIFPVFPEFEDEIKALFAKSLIEHSETHSKNRAKWQEQNK